MANPEYIHHNQSNTIFKFNVMPLPTKERLGDIGIYAGETNSTYMHGYIYECVEGASYVDFIAFDPGRIAFDYRKGTLAAFFGEVTESYEDIVSGTFEYLKDGNIWSINALDKDGNTIFEEYKLYTEDLEDAGFVMLWPIEEYKDGEKITYEFTHNKELNFEWQRVQP